LTPRTTPMTPKKILRREMRSQAKMMPRNEIAVDADADAVTDTVTELEV